MRGVILSALLVTAAMGAYAQDAGSALQEAGLVGTWSPDCSQDADGNGQRIVFAASSAGATEKFVSRIIKIDWDVLSVSPMGDGRFKIVTQRTNIWTLMPGTPQPEGVREAIIEKVGDGWRGVGVSGPNPVLQRCRD